MSKTTEPKVAIVGPSGVESVSPWSRFYWTQWSHLDVAGVDVVAVDCVVFRVQAHTRLLVKESDK